MAKKIKVATGKEHRFKRRGRKYFGQIKGPAGLLVQWPFLLKRNGKPVNDALLDGSTINKFQNEAWISGPNGEFRFEDVPDADYGIEVLSPAGKLIPKQYTPPGETGRRSPLPPVLDRLAFTEDPDDLMTEGEEAYVISAEVRSIGDTLLVNQDVRIIDPDTLEQVGDVITTGDDGVVRAMVPVKKTYRIEIVDQEFEPVELPHDPDDEPAVLLCHFCDESGVPLAYQDVEVQSGDNKFELATDENGRIEAAAQLIPYELKIGDQVFHAHALLWNDREKDENLYRFVVASDTPQETPEDHEHSYDAVIDDTIDEDSFA
jgi:hypothetical protein